MVGVKSDTFPFLILIYTKMYLRGFTDFVALNDDVSSHLIDHHLSRESVSERELILARAGLLVITEKQMENMMVFPAYCYTLGKYWQALKTCYYPRHQDMGNTCC